MNPAAEPDLVDLVCGPVSPLPETYQRYRLVARLGSGGQADVYRGVRLCGGVASAPITVKVFRIDPRRPLADELRSWDKGDAALMDLNNRGVPGICRRADGFYGPPPHPAGVSPNLRDAVPYQIYDYLHGVNLREYVTSRAGLSGARLSAPDALHSLAETIRALHHPADPGACAVLHMDIKASNVMVLSTGEVRLIDFTGARYWRHEEITQIAYTPESGGPEALQGEVGPSYDVHGFGAVVFYMLTGASPRGRDGGPIDRHSIFEGRPALRDHLMAALADRPTDRPPSAQLDNWVDRLLTLVRASGVPDLGLDWAEPKVPVPVGAEAARAVGRVRPLAGTETEAYHRIELLERELVALRANAPTSPVGELLPVPVLTPVSGGPAAPTSGGPGRSNGGSARSGGVEMRPGRAAVVPRAPSEPSAVVVAPAPRERGAKVSGAGLRRLRKGSGWSVTAAVFSFLCWGLWAAANRAAGIYVAPSLYLGTLGVAVGLFVVMRLAGRMVIENWMHKTRRSAVGAHLVVALFLYAVGVSFLVQTSWIVHAYRFIKGL